MDPRFRFGGLLSNWVEVLLGLECGVQRQVECFGLTHPPARIEGTLDESPGRWSEI